MSDKSHVSLEVNVCPICGAEHDTGALLLDKRGRASMERKTTTGFSICPTCAVQLNDDRIALVETKQPAWGRSEMKADEAQRTGQVAWMRREAFRAVFNTTDERGGKQLPMVFVEEGVIARLQAESEQAPTDQTH